MNRRHCIAGLLVWLALGALCVGQAGAPPVGPYGSQQDLTKYEVRVKKFEVSYDGGANWTTIFEGQSNLVDLTQGENAGTFFTNQSVPIGTINRVRVTIDDDMTINGRVFVNPVNGLGGNYYTVDDPDDSDASNDPSNSDNRADQDTKVPGGDIVKEEDVNVVVAPGQAVVLRVTIYIRNSDNAIRVNWYAGPWNYMVFPQDVTVDVTQTS